MFVVPASPSLLVLSKNFDDYYVAETLKRREKYWERILAQTMELSTGG